MKIGFLFLYLTCIQIGSAQFLPSPPQWEKQESESSEQVKHEYLRKMLSTPLSNRGFDATYYRLDLTISTSPNLLLGKVTAKVVSTNNSLSLLTLDLIDRMRVDSVFSKGIRLSFQQTSSTLLITLDRQYAAGEVVQVEVSYGGLPTSTGFGSFEFGSRSGIPWIWSLSQPYGARDWWPCNDHPLDKADSVDVVVTCNSAFKVGSNGILRSVTDNGNGTRTHWWSHRYPIATYLVSIALTDFVEFSDWFKYSATDSMQVLNYVLPEQLSFAQQDLKPTVDMLRIFSEKFGLYPFIKEKYGHSAFGRGGAMEHQTMTSTTSYLEFIIAHELAHQWFGNMITCRTWPDLWLNEGFATYSEAIYFESQYGPSRYWSDMKDKMANAKRAAGSVYRSDSSSVSVLFNRALVYDKGASVLHMLRRVMSDSVFFAAIKAYATDNQFRYRTASTDDFRQICESVSGKPLTFFFDEWIYGESYPHYTYHWSAARSSSGFDVTIALTQTTKSARTPFFVMPIDFKFSNGAWDTTVVLFNSMQQQSFVVQSSHRPVKVELDPEGWILRDVTNRNELPPLPERYGLSQNFPNPFNTGTTFGFDLPHRSHVKIQILDLLGQGVRLMRDDIVEAGSHQVEWDGRTEYGETLASGVYFYRIEAESRSGGGVFSSVRKLLLLK